MRRHTPREYCSTHASTPGAHTLGLKHVWSCCLPLSNVVLEKAQAYALANDTMQRWQRPWQTLYVFICLALRLL